MKSFLLIFSTIALLFIVGAGTTAFADPIIVDGPKQLNIDRPIFLDPPIIRALADFTIESVVKEFLYTSSYGTYYRYHATVVNRGGSCENCQIKVKALCRYGYPNHSSSTVSEYEIVSVPNGDQGVVVTFVVNENKLSGYQYPNLFIVTFSVDADGEYLELNEDNNTWFCDDFLSECDVCVSDDCP